MRPEPPLNGLATEASLTSALTPLGERITRARYAFMPMAGRQFFSLRLPEGAELWSVLVNGEGVKPSKQDAVKGGRQLLISLPPSGRNATVNIEALYREKGNPLRDSMRLRFEGPSLDIPISKTSWNLFMPQGFEYLSYGGSLLTATTVRQPVVTFLRTAYYPNRILFEESRLGGIIVLTLVLLGILAAAKGIRSSSIRAKNKLNKMIPGAPRPKPVEEKKDHGPVIHFSILELLVVLAIIAILAAIAVPNFLEAQVRSKVSRVKTDMRSLATAIEAYYVDNNQYPPQAELLHQGPVKYITSLFPDPNAEQKGSSFHYVAGEQAAMKAARLGLAPPDWNQPGKAPKSFWLLYGLGPDGKDDSGEIIYDPTNGTVSAGDIVRVSQSGWQPPAQTYSQVQSQEKTDSNAKMAAQINAPQATLDLAQMESRKAGLEARAIAGAAPQAAPAPSASSAIPPPLASPASSAPVMPSSPPVSSAGAARCC